MRSSRYPNVLLEVAASAFAPPKAERIHGIARHRLPRPIEQRALESTLRRTVPHVIAGHGFGPYGPQTGVAGENQPRAPG